MVSSQRCNGFIYYLRVNITQSPDAESVLLSLICRGEGE